MTPADAARRWAATWQRAWEALDVDAVVALYHADTRFSPQPFRAELGGRDGVRAYVSGAFAEERDVRARFGSPIMLATAPRSSGGRRSWTRVAT